MKRVLLSIIRFYRRRVSPGLPRACRFYPTCSEYAEEAVKRFGAVRGAQLAARRILRCHPFAKGGYDPVPEAPSAIIRRDENP